MRHSVVGALSALIVLTVAPGGVRAADSQRPTVNVTWPPANVTLSGAVTLTASAWDDVGVTQAKWFVDSVEVGWDGAAPWAATWNANSRPLAWHSVQAR